MKLIYSSFFILLVGYLALGGFQYKKVLGESLQVIREDIGYDLATAQVLSAQKKIETLKKFGFSDLRIISETTVVDRHSFFETQVPLIVDGALVGMVVDNPSMITLLSFVLGSTYLGVLFSILFVFISLVVIVPLARYKKEVQRFIKSAKISPLEQQEIEKDDEVTSQIREIINLNTDYKLKIHQLDYEIKENEAVSNLAKQVAHDIRSPLSVLNMLVPSMANEVNSEKCGLLIQATQRIDQIAENLLSRGRVGVFANVISTSDVEKLVLEKQMLIASQSKKTKIRLHLPRTKMFKICISKIDFERIASNLLNNAIEAISDDQHGLVDLELLEVENSTVFVIKDNGKGIAENILNKIGTKGFTQGKSNGNGLGVYHAISTIEQAGGKFQIKSQLGLGTAITVFI